MVRISTLLTILLLLSVSWMAQAQDPQYPADALLTFPDDHYSHLGDDVVDPNTFAEWWYYTAVMNDDDTGDLWGFQITLFSIPFAGQRTFLYEVALSNAEAEVFYHQRGLGFGAENFGEGPAIFDDGSFSLTYLESDGWRVTYEGETIAVESRDTFPLSLEIEVMNDGSDYIFHSEDGLVAMGSLDDCALDRPSLDGFSWYYSQPNSPTTMSIQLGDDDANLSGLAWFDHQWGNFADCNLAWNWWGLRLDDGRNLILTQILGDDGEVLPGLPSGSIYYPDGSAVYLSQDDIEFEILREWTNEREGEVFGLEWRLGTPDGDIFITPYFDDQTLPPTPVTTAYWEGIVSITDADGELIGRGYLEVLPRNITD